MSLQQMKTTKKYFSKRFNVHKSKSKDSLKSRLVSVCLNVTVNPQQGHYGHAWTQTHFSESRDV